MMKQPKLHRWADKCTEILVFFIVIFSPWAFGTTESWSIWTINITSYGLGILLVLKWIIRRKSRFINKPYRITNKSSTKQKRERIILKTCTILIAVFMIFLLVYIITSAINARASFNLETKEYSYFDSFNRNLPHSYDANATWNIFWQYLGLVILFWSTRDWLDGGKIVGPQNFLNPRVKRLIFLICVNGGLVTLEGILQRTYYNNTSGKLLFLIEPTINYLNSSQFGPFAYRSNAASYSNLIWPLGIGLFIQMSHVNIHHGKFRIGSGTEIFLIPIIISMVCAPIISSSRAGAVLMLGLIIISSFLALFMNIGSIHSIMYAYFPFYRILYRVLFGLGNH